MSGAVRRAAEAAAVAALVSVAALEAQGTPARSWPLSAHLLVLLLVGAGLLLSRSRPVAGTALAVLPMAVQAAGDFVGSAGLLVLFLLLTGRAAAVHDPRHRQVAVALVVLGLVVVLLSDPTTGTLVTALPSLVMFGGALAIGATLARRSRAAADQLAAAEQARADEEERGRTALAEERTRLARELHDVVTHSLSVVVVQAGAARLGAPPEQAERLAAIEDTARSALGEMRRLLGVLRGEAGAQLSPQPGLDQLPDLLAQLRAADTPARVVVEGTPRPLPPGLDLTAYRVVQEAVTNVLNHARGSGVEICFAWQGPRLVLRVVDDGRGTAVAASGGGRGLQGLAERAALYGGHLRHGPLGAGYQVVVELPLTDAHEPVA